MTHGINVTEIVRQTKFVKQTTRSRK